MKNPTKNPHFYFECIVLVFLFVLVLFLDDIRIKYLAFAVLFAFIIGLFWKKKERKERPLKIIIPPELKNGRSDSCKGYSKLKKTYGHRELRHHINGKKVKYWKAVYSGDDQDGDEYIPIFYKRK